MEYNAALSGGIDELKPSLFELLAENQLSALLPPTLRYLLAVATHRHPRYLIRILNNFDEAYAALFLLIERHFLRTYGGSFTENFYGLKRERVLRIRGGEVPRAQHGAPSIVREVLKLRNSDVWLNLLVMVGIPYLKRKLDEGYEVHVPAAQAQVLGAGFQRREELRDGASVRERWMAYYKWFLRRVYPSVNAAYYFAMLAFNLAYLFDGSKYHSPFLWLIGTRIRRLNNADFMAISAAEETPSKGARPGQGGSIFNPRVFITILPKLLSGLKILLPTSIFALKFLEWWHASDFARQLSKKANEGLELPPPVVSGWLEKLEAQKKAARKIGKESDKEKEKEKVQQLEYRTPISSTTGLPIFTVPQPEGEKSNQCPICLGEIQTATASPYGYVYCYQCIHRWVEGMTERQKLFMEGSEEEGVWSEEQGGDGEQPVTGGREGRWENGQGRDAISGRRILGGTEGLRRVVV